MRRKQTSVDLPLALQGSECTLLRRIDRRRTATRAVCAGTVTTSNAFGRRGTRDSAECDRDNSQIGE